MTPIAWPPAASTASAITPINPTAPPPKTRPMPRRASSCPSCVAAFAYSGGVPVLDPQKTHTRRMVRLAEVSRLAGRTPVYSAGPALIRAVSAGRAQYNLDVKITIVGAGIIGCAIAHELASRGAAVCVIDMRGTGRGATQASAGILAPYIEGHIDALLQLGVHSLALWDAYVARVGQDAEQTIEYERSGSLHVARNDAAALELAIAARRLAHDGVAHELMPGHDACRLEPGLSPNLISALLLPMHGYVRASELTSALAFAAARSGAEFVTASVTEIAGGRTPAVKTTGGRIESDAVILAAGSWSGRVEPVTAPVRPVP